MPSLAELSQKAVPVIQRYTGKILAGAVRTSVWNTLVAAGKSVSECAPEEYIAAALPGLCSYVRSDALAQCERELREAMLGPASELGPPSAALPISPRSVATPARAPESTAGAASASVVIEHEADVVRARNEARRLCAGLAYGATDTVRCCTVVSELARNIVQYAGTGSIELREVAAPTRGIAIVARDRGPGIPNLRAILDGSYTSKTGMGRGLLGTRAILQNFEVTTRSGEGTTVRGVFRTR